MKPAGTLPQNMQKTYKSEKTENRKIDGRDSTNKAAYDNC